MALEMMHIRIIKNTKKITLLQGEVIFSTQLSAFFQVTSVVLW